MATKKKAEGLTAEMQNVLLSLTKDSPLLLLGTVQARVRMRGKNQNGDWEFLRLEVKGTDGRTVSATINDPDTVPPVGEFVILPVYVDKGGYLREARIHAMETF